MKCPTCKDVTLVMSTRQEIEIDYCPECRGVWLDRGELDKIIEKSNTAMIQNSAQTDHYKQTKDRYKDDDDYKYKRKKSFLSEIFD